MVIPLTLKRIKLLYWANCEEEIFIRDYAGVCLRKKDIRNGKESGRVFFVQHEFFFYLKSFRFLF